MGSAIAEQKVVTHSVHLAEFQYHAEKCYSPNPKTQGRKPLLLI
jgi:hypothetical protein